MDEMICFLNTHAEIRTAVLLLGKDYSYKKLKHFITQAGLSKLSVINCDRDNDEKELQESLEWEQKLQLLPGETEVSFIKLDKFSSPEKDWALCGDEVSPELLYRLRVWKPTYLLATVPEDYISAFKLWEAYKEETSYIQIRTKRQHREDQILEWEKKGENPPELSVIFPMYNVAAYLDQCIESVTAWKAPYIEFLFVNDGSPDDSREVVLKWAKKDPRIRLLDKENGGCASARQFGLERARGRYIGFIDPDDFIDESMFRKLLRAAMTGSYDISYCGYNEYYENTGETRRAQDTLGEPYISGTSDRRAIQELIVSTRIAIWRSIFKKEMLDSGKVHFYTDLKRFDDLPFKAESFAACRSVIAVPEFLYYYRLARPGQDVSADDERLYVHFTIFRYLDASIAGSQDPRLVDLLLITKLNTHLWAIGKIKEEFKDTYIDRAREDLERSGEFRRAAWLIENRSGKKEAESYKAIMQKDYKYFRKEKS